MIREVIYEIKALYRDDFRVTGFRLGQGSLLSVSLVACGVMNFSRSMSVLS